MPNIPAVRRAPEADPSTFAGGPEHERRSALRSRRRVAHHRERLTAEERKALLDVLRTSASRSRACDMAGIPYKSLESWLYIAQGKHPQRPATPWHKALLRDVLKAEATPLVLMEGNVVAASRTHPGPAVRYMLARYPEEFSRPDEVAPVGPNHVQENVIIIPAERVPEFARFLARAEPSLGSQSGLADPHTSLRLIEE